MNLHLPVTRAFGGATTDMVSYALLSDIVNATKSIMSKSIYKYSISDRFDFRQYKIKIEQNCIIEYRAIYLNIPKLVMRAARPSRIKSLIQLIFPHFDVKGDATDASSSERDTPTDARFNAPQSFAPSPQNEHVKSMFS